MGKPRVAVLRPRQAPSATGGNISLLGVQPEKLQVHMDRISDRCLALHAYRAGRSFGQSRLCEKVDRVTFIMRRDVGSPSRWSTTRPGPMCLSPGNVRRSIMIVACFCEAVRPPA